MSAYADKTQQRSNQNRAHSNPLQQKTTNNPLAPIGYTDNPLQMYAQPDPIAQRQADPDEEELNQGMFEPVKRVANEEDELLLGKFEPAAPVQQLEVPVQKKPNNTGLPDNLKEGIEDLSGYSMDDVKVHYNSGKPAQLQALAYAQGTDIHVGPGQEQHLPHEAWHVVQQKQGRVEPTMQMKGDVPVNDDKGLENEADVMGKRVITQKMPKRLYTIQKKSVIDEGGLPLFTSNAWSSDHPPFQGNRQGSIAQMKLTQTAKNSVYMFKAIQMQQIDNNKKQLKTIQRVLDVTGLGEDHQVFWQLLRVVLQAIDPDVLNIIENGPKIQVHLNLHNIVANNTPKGATIAVGITDDNKFFDMNPDGGVNPMDLFLADCFLINVDLDINNNKHGADYLHTVAHEIIMHVRPYATVASAILSLNGMRETGKISKAESFREYKRLIEPSLGLGGMLDDQHHKIDSLDLLEHTTQIMVNYLYDLGEVEMAKVYYNVARLDIDTMKSERILNMIRDEKNRKGKNNSNDKFKRGGDPDSEGGSSGLGGKEEIV